MTGNSTRKKWTQRFAKILTAAMLLSNTALHVSAETVNQAAEIPETQINAEISDYPALASAASDSYLGVNPGAEVPESFTNDLWLQYDFREMEIGDTARLNPRRVEEAIANSVTNNVQMPDFHYNVIQGDSITIEDMDESPSQAYANVTAVKEGTSVVQVTYDPFTHETGKSFAGTDPVNTAYVIYSVGGNKNISILDNIIEKEADRTSPEDVVFRSYDTLYFAEGDAAPFTLKASAKGAKSILVKCNGLTVAENGDGSYPLLLENRSNIVEITATAEDGTTRSKFHVLDARKIKVNIENKYNPGHKLSVGDTAVVSFNGITMPVYKLASIYNPRMGKDATYVHYDCEETKYIGRCKQWNLATQNSFEVPLTKAGEYTFHSGGIYCGWWGSTLGTDKTKDNPGAPNMNADVLEDEFSFMPDFSFTVTESEGDITFSMERFTIGQGFFVEPTSLHFNPGETAASLIERYLREHNIQYENSGTVDSGFYLLNIAGADLGADKVSVPAYISQYFNGPTTQSAQAYGNGDGSLLGEKSYSDSAGWYYLINNKAPDVGMSDYKLRDGDVIRLSFTLTWGQDLTGCELGANDPIVNIINKDNILKALCAFGAREQKEELLADANTKTAYQTLKELAYGIEGTDEAIAAAIQALDQAVNDGMGLAQYKMDKKKELETYKDKSAYPQEQQKQLEAAIQAGKKAIQEAADAQAVDNALQNAKAALDQIPITVAVTSITLNKNSLSLYTGAKAQLKATLTPANATDSAISWKSSAIKIAQVDNKGKVTAVKPGTATITASSGQKKATCLVTVTAPKLKLNYTTLKLQKGKSTTAVKIKSSTPHGEKISSAKSSRPGVASVKISKGALKITGKKAGKSVVTITSANGGTAKVTIQVQKKVHVKSLALNKQNLNLKKGGKFTLKITRKPITATDSITWITSDNKVASVNAKGVVKAKKKGKVTITAKSSNGKKITCKITVK